MRASLRVIPLFVGLALVLGCGGSKSKGTVCQAGSDCPGGGCYETKCVTLCKTSCDAGQLCVRKTDGTEQCVSSEQVQLSDNGTEDVQGGDLGREDSGNSSDLGSEDLTDTLVDGSGTAGDILGLDGSGTGGDVITLPDSSSSSPQCPADKVWPVGLAFPFEVNYLGPRGPSHTVEVSGLDTVLNQAIVPSQNHVMLSMYGLINSPGPRTVSWTIKNGSGAVVATVSCSVTAMATPRVQVVCNPKAYQEFTAQLCAESSTGIQVEFLGQTVSANATFDYRAEVISSTPTLAFSPTSSLGQPPSTSPGDPPSYTFGQLGVTYSSATGCQPGTSYTVRVKVTRFTTSDQTVLETDERECEYICRSCL